MKQTLSILSCALLGSFLATAVQAGDALKCEKRINPARSKISVKAEDLIPGAIYSSIVYSGKNSAVSSIAANSAGEAEFDFDSNMANIMAGAKQIAPSFINQAVTTTVTDAMGSKIINKLSAACRIK